MRKAITFIMFLSICLSFGAIKDNVKSKEVILSKKFIGVEIASFYFKDTNDLNKESSLYFDMLLSYEELNKMVNEYSKKYKIIDKNYIETKIESINGVAYLRSYTDDGYVTTTALKPSYSSSRNKMVLMMEGVSCTSSDRSSNKGCIPDSGGTSCTSSLGDCSKTVTKEKVVENDY